MLGDSYDVLITSGYGQGIDLVTHLLLEPETRLILEEFTLEAL